MRLNLISLHFAEKVLIGTAEYYSHYFYLSAASGSAIAERKANYSTEPDLLELMLKHEVGELDLENPDQIQGNFKKQMTIREVSK